MQNTHAFLISHRYILFTGFQKSISATLFPANTGTGAIMINRERKQAGSITAFSIACTFVLLIIGITMFFIVRLLGGNCELQSATDSGALNVAKKAVLNPYTTLSNTALLADPQNQQATEQSNFLLLCDKQNNQNVVNLKVYNRFVGQVLLVSLNAQSDGSPQAIAHAVTLTKQLELPGGIGDRLSKQLGQNNIQTIDNFFNSLGLSNSIRMLNKSAPSHPGIFSVNNNNYRLSYMGQRPQDAAATNLLAPSSEQLPSVPNYAALPSGSTIRKTFKNKNTDYIRGYVPLNVLGRAAPSILGVPVQPQEQPHLVSAKDFSAQINPPQGDLVPPNSFQTSAQASEDVTFRHPVTNSCAIVGVLGTQYAPAIPGGYLVIHNPQGNDNPGGTMGNFDTVLNGELDTPGIDANYDQSSGQYYYGLDPLVQQWRQHLANPYTTITVTKYRIVMVPDPLPRHPFHMKRVRVPYTETQKVKLCPFDGPGYSSPNAPIDGLYMTGKNGAGKTVNCHQAHNHNYGNIVICTDTNTFPEAWQGGRHICDNLLPSFEKSWDHNPGSYQNTVVSVPKSLTAVETMKSKVEHLFNHCAYLNTSEKAPPTGLRVYNCGIGSNCPWPQWETEPDNVNYRRGDGLNHYNPAKYNFPQISHNGTLSELIGQVSDHKQPAKATNMQKFIANRLAQMSGKTGAELQRDVDFILNQQRIPMGPDIYIYYTAGANNLYTQLHMDTNKPPGFTGALPDGRAITLSSEDYWPRAFARNVIRKYINSDHDHGTDKFPFQQVNGRIGVNESITLTPSSGYQNLLGVISMQEVIDMNNRVFFCQPN